MIQITTYEYIVSIVEAERVRDSFTYYKDKYKEVCFLKYHNEAVFSFVRNKNNIYEGQVFFLAVENTNEILQLLKVYLNARFIPYVLNKNRNEVFDKIEESLLHLKMHSFVLNQKLKSFSNDYKIVAAQNDEKLEAFYIDCFKEEFDENAVIWLRDFEQMAPGLAKGNLQIKINNEIAASIMYWVQKDSIFIFLLATHPNYRRKKLAFVLIQAVQKKYPTKNISLTTWAGGATEKFYLNIGFEKLAMAHICM